MKMVLLILISPFLLLMFVFGFLRWVITREEHTINHAFDIIEELLKK